MWIDDNDFLEAEAMDDIKILISDVQTPEEAVETLLLHGYPTKKVFEIAEDKFNVIFNVKEEEKDFIERKRSVE